MISTTGPVDDSAAIASATKRGKNEKSNAIETVISTTGPVGDSAAKESTTKTGKATINTLLSKSGKMNMPMSTPYFLFPKAGKSSEPEKRP